MGTGLSKMKKSMAFRKKNNNNNNKPKETKENNNDQKYNVRETYCIKQNDVSEDGVAEEANDIVKDSSSSRSSIDIAEEESLLDTR